jgi:hypothetical protein
MPWLYDPSTWVDNVTIPHVVDYQHIADDIHRWGATVDGGVYSLVNLGGMLLTSTAKVGLGVASPQYAMDIAGDVNITGAFRVNGVPITAGGGAQTPWVSDITGGGYRLLGAAISVCMWPARCTPWM